MTILRTSLLSYESTQSFQFRRDLLQELFESLQEDLSPPGNCCADKTIMRLTTKQLELFEKSEKTESDVQRNNEHDSRLFKVCKKINDVMREKINFDKMTRFLFGISLASGGICSSLSVVPTSIPDLGHWQITLGVIGAGFAITALIRIGKLGLCPPLDARKKVLEEIRQELSELNPPQEQDLIQEIV